MLVSDETQVAYKRSIGELGSMQRCIVSILQGKFRELRHYSLNARCKKSMENDLCMEFSLQCNPEIGWEKIVNWAVNNWRGERLKVNLSNPKLLQ